MSRQPAKRGARPAQHATAAAAAELEESRARGHVRDLEELREAAETRRRLAIREAELVHRLRVYDVPWRLIADALGTTAQAAQQRFGKAVL